MNIKSLAAAAGCRISGEFKALATLLRLDSFDTSTIAGRSRERYRRIAFTALATGMARGISILTALITVPLTLNYLGAERYGMWATMSSVIAILGFADFGIANGLLNAVAEANGKDDRELARCYVSSAFFFLVGIAVFLAVAFVVVYPLVPWSRVFNVSSSQAVIEAGPAVAVFFGCFIFNIILGVVERIRLGYQEGFINGVWIGIGNLLGLGGVLVATQLRAGLPWLVLAMAGAPALVRLLNGVFLFGITRRWLRPQWSNVTTIAVRKVLRLGFLFFVLQVASTAFYSSDNIVIAQVLGAEQVAQYSVPAKMFSFVSILSGLVLSPLWPAYGEAMARRDTIWVKKTLTNSIIVSFLVAAVSSVFMVVFGKILIQMWVGPAIVPSYTLLIGLGIWTLLYGVLNPIAMFLNGANIVGFQVITSSLMAVVNLTISILLVHVMGAPGAIYGTVISLVICSLIPIAIYVPRFLSLMQPSADVRQSKGVSF